MTTELKTITKGECRNKHSDHHNHHSNLARCDNCDAMVEILNKNLCSCCLLKLVTRKKKNSKYNPVKKIMNKLISKYDAFLPYYEEKVMPYNIALLGQVEHQIILYEIDLRYAILFLKAQEMNEEDRHKAYELIRKNIKEVKFVVSWGRSKAFKLFVDDKDH